MARSTARICGLPHGVYLLTFSHAVPQHSLQVIQVCKSMSPKRCLTLPQELWPESAPGINDRRAYCITFRPNLFTIGGSQAWGSYPRRGGAGDSKVGHDRRTALHRRGTNGTLCNVCTSVDSGGSIYGTCEKETGLPALIPHTPGVGMPEGVRYQGL